MTPERELFQAVVERALMDAFWTGRERNNVGALSEMVVRRDQATSWLQGRTQDFRMICALAGIDPDYLSDAFRAGKIDRDSFYNAQAARAKSEVAQKRWAA